MIAFGFVVLWSVFSYAYLGVEDGSSGLSPLGWISAVFFVPGGLLLYATKGAHSNTGLPTMAVFSFCAYVVVLLFVIKGVARLRRLVGGVEPDQAINTEA
jgi:hypothetical protein